MASSPASSRRHSRRLSNLDIVTPTSPIHSFSRRSSGFSPVTRRSSHRYSGDISAFQTNGMENLADELADAWDSDDDEVDEGLSQLEGEDLERPLGSGEAGQWDGEGDAELSMDSGVDMASSFVSTPSKDTFWSPPPPSSSKRTKHLRGYSESVVLDRAGSKSASLNHAFDNGIPPSLNAAMADIEGLAKQKVTVAREGGSRDEDIQRALDSFKDLGGQTVIESGATRLATAHAAVSTNLTRQARTLHSSSYALLSPLAFPLDVESIDGLIAIITATITFLPQPTSQALSSMTRLAMDTREVVALLNNLSDSLHMSRQITDAAARRLRSAREMVSEFRKDDVACESGKKWIEEGNWHARLADRECAKVCQEVVGGFEEVCNGWRERLVASAGIGAA